MRLRNLWFSLRWLVIAGLGTITAFAFFLASETGTRWLFARVDGMLGETLVIGQVTGRLFSSLSVADVRFDDSNQSLEIKRLQLDWQPAGLFNGVLFVNQLTLNDVTYRPAKEPATDDPQAPPASFEIPIAVVVQTMEVTNLQILGSAGPTVVDAIRFSADADRERIRIDELRTSGPNWRALANISLSPVAPYDLNIAADWALERDGLWDGGSVRVSGNTEQADLRAVMRSPFKLESEGSIKRDGDDVRVNLQGAWASAQWPLAGEPTLVSQSGSFEIGGGLDDFTMTVEADLEVAGTALESFAITADGGVSASEPYAFELAADWRARVAPELDVTGKLNAQGNLKEVTLDNTVLTPFPVETTVTVTSLEDTPHFDFTGSWREGYWPLGTSPSVTGIDGSVKSSGTLESIDLSLDTTLNINQTLRDLAVQIAAKVDLKDTIRFESKLNWQGILVATESEFQGEGNATGALNETIVFSHRLSLPFVVETKASVDLSEATPALQLQTQWHDVTWPPGGTTAIASPTGELTLNGWLDDIKASMRAALQGDGLPVEDFSLDMTGGLSSEDAAKYSARVNWSSALITGGELNGEATVDGDQRDLRFTHLLTSPFKVDTEGSIDLSTQVPQVVVSGQWQQAFWPLTGTIEYESAIGHYRLAGPSDALVLVIDGDLSGGALPPIGFSMQGVLNPAVGLQLESGRLDTLGGRVETGGLVQWSPAPTWDLTIDLSDIDPGKHWVDWPGRLAGALAVSGLVEGGVVRAKASIRKLGGTLRDYPVSATGVLEVDGQRVEAQTVALASGPNRLQLDGVYDEAIDLDFSLEAPDLSQVLPGLKGNIRGSGKASGTLTSPALNMTAEGRDIGYLDNTAQSLSVRTAITVNEQTASSLVLRLEGVRAGGQNLDFINVEGKGTRSNHRLEIAIDSSIADLVTQLDGAVLQQGWAGTLNKLDLDTPGAGTWRLRAPVALVMNDKLAKTDPLCLMSKGEGTLCSDLLWERSKNTANGNITIRSLPLALAEPWLPDDWKLTGNLSADGKFATQDGEPQGQLSVSISPGELSMLRTVRQRLVVRHTDTSAKLTLTGGTLTGQLAAIVTDDGKLRANVRIDSLSESGRLDGQVDASLPTLDLVAPFVQGLERIQGSAKLSAKLGGTLGDPHAVGTATVTLASAQVPDAGIELVQSSITVGSDAAQRFHINGNLNSGGGKLDIQGRGLLKPGSGFPLDLTLKGADFEVIKLPDAQVFASPDLKIKVTQQLISVTGKVRIPKAIITPKDIATSAVKVSSDEVIINQPSSAKKTSTTKKATPVSVDIVIELGDDVIFDGFGLTSKLGGTLKLSQSSEGTTAGHGDLNLIGGKFTAYGQDLEIERGRLLFAGPLDNPGLDVRAVRKTGSVKAGILIGGTANSLSSKIFSEPAMSEAEALSYLLTGRPLSGANQGDAALLSQAALSLGLQGSQHITQQLQSMFGLDELSVGGGATGNTSLILGKRLTPDVTVRYALGLFDTVGAFFLNYRLSDNFSLEAESGERQGLDLLFNYEK